MKKRENRTDDGEVSHANLLGEAFLDQRHAGEPVPVTGVLLFDRLHKVPWKNISRVRIGSTVVSLTGSKGKNDHQNIS